MSDLVMAGNGCVIFELGNNEGGGEVGGGNFGFGFGVNEVVVWLVL